MNNPNPDPNPTPIPYRFSMKLCCGLYSDNALVYYKPHSLSSGGTGTVRNSKTKARRT